MNRDDDDNDSDVVIVVAYERLARRGGARLLHIPTRHREEVTFYRDILNILLT